VSELQAGLTGWLTELAAVLPFGFAFGVRMVAAINPCGFAMLPASLSLYLGMEEGDLSNAPLRPFRYGRSSSAGGRGRAAGRSGGARAVHPRSDRRLPLRRAGEGPGRHALDGRPARRFNEDAGSPRLILLLSPT
jgi:hypothetical protein